MTYVVVHGKNRSPHQASAFLSIVLFRCDSPSGKHCAAPVGKVWWLCVRWCSPHYDKSQRLAPGPECCVQKHWPQRSPLLNPFPQKDVSLYCGGSSLDLSNPGFSIRRLQWVWEWIESKSTLDCALLSFLSDAWGSDHWEFIWCVYVWLYIAVDQVEAHWSVL